MRDEIKLTKLANCAGCGAKVGAGTLAQLLSNISVKNDPNLLVGFDKSDDAAVYRLTEDLAIVQTLDFFPPVADDPYTYGAIAAANALSDIYAMGGTPVTALNIMAIPETLPKEAVHEILRGGYDKVFEAGAVIAGGHSIYDDSPKYGLSVTGVVNPARILSNSAAKPGDKLILTKPLGIGALTTGIKAGLASKEAADIAYQSMLFLNKYAAEIMTQYRVHSCTDITGFGLLGHSYEMALGSDAEIRLHCDKIRFLPEAESLAKDGILPAGMYRNRNYCEQYVDCGTTALWTQDLLYDPQTSGGLLIAAAPEDADSLLLELKNAIPWANIIGDVTKYCGEARIFLE